MKAKAKVLVDLEKYWGNGEDNSVRVAAVVYSSVIGLVSRVRIVRTIVIVDGKDEIDTLTVSNTWPDGKLVQECVHKFEGLVESHPSSYLIVKNEPVAGDTGSNDIPF